MSTPPQVPSPMIPRKPLSPSPFNPPDLPPLSAHVASEAAMPAPVQAPPPTPPPKDRPPEAKLQPQAHQHARPGTPDFFLQNSTYSMPGAYPTTPGGLTTTRTHSSSPLAADPRTLTADPEMSHSPQPTTPSPGKRRASGNSIRTLLSSLRKPSSQSARDPRTSGDSYGGTAAVRPDTPGRDSITSSIRPTLRKKMSGTFWGKRKSSLGLEMMMNKGDQNQNNGSTPETLRQENGLDLRPEHTSPSPLADEASESGSMLKSIRQRKSGTFWSKRRSTMGNELNAENLDQEAYQDHAGITSTAAGPNIAGESPEPLRKQKSGTFWPRKLSLSLQRETNAAGQREGGGSGRMTSPTSGTRHSAAEESVDMAEEEPYVHVERPRSPPPKLPELNLQAGDGQGSFLSGGAEDLFGRIGRDS